MNNIFKYSIVFALTAMLTACEGTLDKTASNPAKDPSPVTQPKSKPENDFRNKPSFGVKLVEDPVNSQKEDSQGFKNWTSLIPEGWHVFERV